MIDDDWVFFSDYEDLSDIEPEVANDPEVIFHDNMTELAQDMQLFFHVADVSGPITKEEADGLYTSRFQRPKVRRNTKSRQEVSSCSSNAPRAAPTTSLPMAQPDVSDEASLVSSLPMDQPDVLGEAIVTRAAQLDVSGKAIVNHVAQPDVCGKAFVSNKVIVTPTRSLPLPQPNVSDKDIVNRVALPNVSSKAIVTPVAKPDIRGKDIVSSKAIVTTTTSPPVAQPNVSGKAIVTHVAQPKVCGKATVSNKAIVTPTTSLPVAQQNVSGKDIVTRVAQLDVSGKAIVTHVAQPDVRDKAIVATPIRLPMAQTNVTSKAILATMTSQPMAQPNVFGKTTPISNLPVAQLDVSSTSIVTPVAPQPNIPGKATIDRETSESMFIAVDRRHRNKQPINLPEGWRVKESKRKNGKTMGIVDKVYTSPSGQKFRSLKQVKDFLDKQNQGRNSNQGFDDEDNAGASSQTAA